MSDKTYIAQKQIITGLIVTVVMLFAGLTSAVIVTYGQGKWLKLQLPLIFYINTAIIILSSVSMELSLRNLKDGYTKKHIPFLLLTFIFGTFFLIGQCIGYYQLKDMGFYINFNISYSFLYLLTFIHGVHILFTLIALVILIFYSFLTKNTPFCYFRNFSVFWHFLAVLWIFILSFLFFIQS